MKRLLVGIICLMSCLTLFAKLEVASVFSDNMVLQRDVDLMVWGKATANSPIVVEFNSLTIKTSANDKGNWSAHLPPQKANKNPQSLTITGDNSSIKISNILVGEVWLCSGQSNMEWTVAKTQGSEEILANANNSNIRLLKVTKNFGNEASDYLINNDKWQTVNATSVAPFTAVGYLFGVEIQKALDIPIGLINSSWGGTRIEPWTSPEGFRTMESLSAISNRVDCQIPNTERFKLTTKNLIEAHQKWIDDAKIALDSGKLIPAPIKYPQELTPLTTNKEPTTIYNKMIYPLIGMKFRGVLWYQGCANRADGKIYTDKMQALYNGFQEVFGIKDMPFYFVQLAPFGYGGVQHNTTLPKLWEAQENFAKNNPDNVAMAVINDVGNLKDIHPTDKKTVAHRLALLARKYTYNEAELPANSPILDSYELVDNRYVLTFKNAKELKFIGNDNSVAFELASVDGKYYKAKFEINKNKITVYCDELENVTNLHFMWSQIAEASIINEEGLPLGAFRIEKEVDAEGSAKLILQNIEKDFKLVYKHNLISDINPNLKLNYLVDNSEKIKDFSQICYFVVAKNKINNEVSWVLVKMDAFTNNAKLIGVPVYSAKATFQTYVNNMEVLSNVSNVKTGIFPKGYIEFFGTNYNMKNSKNIAGASSAKYDFDDTISSTTAGHGSMQIHNIADKSTIFGYNNFKAGKAADFGFGNAPSGHLDWTFSGNLKNFSEAILYVFVK